MSNPTPRRSLSSLVNGNGHAPAETPKPTLSSLMAPIAVDPSLELTTRTADPAGATWAADRRPPSHPTQARTPAAPQTDRPATEALDENAVEEARRKLSRALVRELGSEASSRVVEVRSTREAAAKKLAADHPIAASRATMSAREVEELHRQIINDLIHQRIQDAIDNEGDALVQSREEEEALRRAVYDYCFGLGWVQPLVDRPDVENILYTNGFTTIMRADGSSEQISGIFDSDEEATDWVRMQGARAAGGGRPFSHANPALRLNLNDRIRLSALGWTSAGVSIAIRKHLHKDIDMQRLVAMRVMPPEVAKLLTATVQEGCSVVVSGPMGVGKTTMVRALASTLPAETRIGTAELVRELFLHHMPGRRPYVVSAEVITGGGERNEFTDQMKGRFDLHAILQEFVSQQLERVIVGEVAGKEILAMFKALQMAHGSMTTVHATTARGCIDRLVTLALEEPGVDKVYAIRQVAAHVQLIVQMRSHAYTDDQGVVRRLRHVSEVAWVEPGEDAMPAMSRIFHWPSPEVEPTYSGLPEPLRQRVIPYGFDIRSWPSHTPQSWSQGSRTGGW